MRCKPLATIPTLASAADLVTFDRTCVENDVMLAAERWANNASLLFPGGVTASLRIGFPLLLQF